MLVGTRQTPLVASQRDVEEIIDLTQAIRRALADEIRDQGRSLRDAMTRGRTTIRDLRVGEDGRLVADCLMRAMTTTADLLDLIALSTEAPIGSA